MIGPEGSGITPDSSIAREARRDQDPTVARVTEAVRTVFPEYTILNTERWDGYNSEDDKWDHGRILRFYRGEVKEEVPQVWFIQKKNGTDHILMYYNNPYSGDEKNRIATPNGTAYREAAYKSEKFWQMDELDLSVEAARIRMEGIGVSSEVVNQPAFILADSTFVSPSTVLKNAEDYKKATKKGKEALRAGISVKNIYTLAREKPDLVRQLVLERLVAQAEQNVPFIMGGKSYDAVDLVGEINGKTEVGQRALLLETMRLGSYIELLNIQRKIIDPDKTT